MLRIATDEPHLATALVVGGTVRARRYLKSCLGALGFDCFEADNGIDALRYCSEFGVDLIITQKAMPLMDGGELLSLVNRGAFGANPPPVIAWTEGDDGPRPPSGGKFADTLSTPIELDRLEKLLSDAMEEGGRQAFALSARRAR